MRVVKRFMPIFSMTFGEGGFAEAVEQLEDEEERAVAWAGHHYFRGEAEQAMELAASVFAQRQRRDPSFRALAARDGRHRPGR